MQDVDVIEINLRPMKKPEFYAKLQQQRKESFTLTTSKVVNAQQQAVETLIDIMNNKDASDGCKIKGKSDNT